MFTKPFTTEIVENVFAHPFLEFAVCSLTMIAV